MSFSLYEAVSHWWLSTVNANETLLAIFLMWIYTEIVYTVVNAIFIAVEASGQFQKYKIHVQPSNHQLFQDIILFHPITWLLDIPVYWMQCVMIGWFSGRSPSPLAPLPSTQRIAVECFVLLFAYDLMFYSWHRALHTKLLWRFHKKHHEIRVPFTCANDHEHIVESSGHILWKMIPPAILGSHLYSVCIYRATVKFFALLHHSGFELPIFQPLQQIPLIASPSHHDHHHYYGWGNFGGVFKIWDQAFGTYAETSPKKKAG